MDLKDLYRDVILDHNKRPRNFGRLDPCDTAADGNNPLCGDQLTVTLRLEGDGNDYVGKGLSGGKLVIYPSPDAKFKAEDNIIVGNVGLYGATSGEVYIRGGAGERFAVRNSGAQAVVESIGDHGCEYMTGGRVVVLGRAGRNFGAGMSGGVAYVFDEHGDFPTRVNRQMVDIEPLDDPEELIELRVLIESHRTMTRSAKAQAILDDWPTQSAKFVKVMPRDYKRMLAGIRRAHQQGLSGEEAIMVAFEENSRDLSRVGGN